MNVSKNIGELIDKIAGLDAEVKILATKIKKINKKRESLEIDLMTAMRKAKLNKASGSMASASIKPSRHPYIENIEKLYSYIIKNRALDLFQRRINAQAYFDRLENDEHVPGVKIFERTSCRVTPKR